MDKVWQSVSAVIPIIFVLGFGYVAGRRQAFGPGPGPVETINKLVLNYALPPLLFVGTVTVSREKLFGESVVFFALFITLIGGYLITFLLSHMVFKRSMLVAAIQALAIAYGAGSFYGPALLDGLYGQTSGVAISMVAMVLNVFMIPLATVLMKIGKERQDSGGKAAGAAALSTGKLVRQSLYHATIGTPFVWAPMIAFVMVLLGIRTPAVVNNSFDLIGNASAGVAVFVCGLILASHKLILNAEVWLNVAAKNVWV